MSNIYADIARRTGGDIYIGVVGPVRTGKSTFIKRLMEELVIPNIEDLYQRERARDELPQSGSGKTIVTAEPKFVPEEAVEISPDGTATLSVRLIDSVGYMVDGAIGATENGVPRMVATPWADGAAHDRGGRAGHAQGHGGAIRTVGLVITTDGTVTDIPRSDYIDAEARAIEDMKATGKPFLVVVNSTAPQSAEAQTLADYISETYGVSAVAADCLGMQTPELQELLTKLLYAFPLRELRVFLPPWVQALELEHPLKAAALCRPAGAGRADHAAGRGRADAAKADGAGAGDTVPRDGGRPRHGDGLLRAGAWRGAVLSRAWPAHGL